MKRYIPRLLKDHGMIEASKAYPGLQEYVRVEDCRDAVASAFKSAYLHAVAVWCQTIDSDAVKRDMSEHLARYLSEHHSGSDEAEHKPTDDERAVAYAEHIEEGGHVRKNEKLCDLCGRPESEHNDTWAHRFIEDVEEEPASPCNHQAEFDDTVFGCDLPKGHRGLHRVSDNEGTWEWGQVLSAVEDQGPTQDGEQSDRKACSPSNGRPTSADEEQLEDVFCKPLSNCDCYKGLIKLGRVKNLLGASYPEEQSELVDDIRSVVDD